MQSVTTIGFDIAKSVFQVHGIGGEGEVVIRRQLKRRHVLVFFQKLPPCLVGIEACASSHYWSRELTALGHTVRLMPPAYVKPYVKRAEERCCRRRGHLRGSHQGSRAAELPGAPSGPAIYSSVSDRGDQCDPSPPCRVRHCCTGRASAVMDLPRSHADVRLSRQTGGNLLTAKPRAPAPRMGPCHPSLSRRNVRGWSDAHSPVSGMPGVGRGRQQEGAVCAAESARL